MTFKRYEDIEAWQRSMSLAEVVYKLTSKAAFDRDWGLRDQMRRAVVSIPSNLAEGFERNSEAEFNRFVLISKGSCGELRTQLILANRIGYLTNEEVESISKESAELCSMLGGLSKYLLNCIQNAKR